MSKATLNLSNRLQGAWCVCVCPPGLQMIIIIIILNSAYSGPGSVLRAHINPYSDLLNWLLGLSHFTDEEKWDMESLSNLPPEFESGMHTFQHFPCSYLSVSTIPSRKTEAIYNFLLETHISKFVPHEHVLATWNVLSWLSLSTLSKCYQPCLSCWEIDSKWLKNSNSVESRFESGTSGSKPRRFHSTEICPGLQLPVVNEWGAPPTLQSWAPHD